MLTWLLDFLGAGRYFKHAICLTDDPLMISLYTFSDLATWAAYFVIGITLLRSRARPFEFSYELRLLYGAFIFLCGLSHLTGVMTLYSGVYRLDIMVRAAMAGVSVTTAYLTMLETKTVSRA